MAKLGRTSIQNYPRIEDEANIFNGFFDDSKVQQHLKELNDEEINAIIIKAVKSANLKSSRAILNIKDNVTESEINKIYKKHGKELFNYFVKYCGDPAATAFDCMDQHYSKIANQQFLNVIQQEKKDRARKLYKAINKSIKSHSPNKFNTNGTTIESGVRFYKLVLKVLLQNKSDNKLKAEISQMAINIFGEECKKNDLVDEKGYFNNPYKLISFLCNA